MRFYRMSLSVVLAGALGMAGCATLLDSAIDAAANRAGERVGEAVGDRIGEAIVRQYSPVFLSWYTSYLFTMAFGAGAYEMGSEYEPGQWTRWERAGEEGPKGRSWMERAFLARVEEDKEWWRVKYFDGESGDTVTIEALFAPGRTKLLRMRMKLPDEEPQEVPVEDQDYVPPRKLTKESIEGAKVGKESVTVPAGAFEAVHCRFGTPGQGTWEWWAADEVPGGVVRYRETDARDEDAPEGAEGLEGDWTLELAAFGDGAKSELGVLE